MNHKKVLMFELLFETHSENLDSFHEIYKYDIQKFKLAFKQ